MLVVLGRHVKQLNLITEDTTSVDVSSEALWAEFDALEGALV